MIQNIYPYILLCILLSFSAFANTPKLIQTAKPNWITEPNLPSIKPNTRDIENGYYFSRLEQQIHVDGQETYWRVTRNIISETGVQNASEISVSFDPTYEKLSFHHITIWRKNKPLQQLNVSKFKIVADEQDLSRFIYQGTYNAYLILEDIRKGDQIDFAYTIKGRNPIFGNNYSAMIYLQGYNYVAQRYTSLITSNSRNLNYKIYNKAAKPQITKSGNYTQYSWINSNQKPLEYEDDTPGWFDICPKVQFSDYRSWQDVAKWANTINPVPNKLEGACAQFCEQLKKASGNNKEKLFRDAVRFVQDDIRYMGIEIGEYSHRANSPAKVYNQRYGDCKDKSLLLVSILRNLGFEANMGLLSTSERQLINNYLPAPTLFDHAVVQAKLNGKNIWIDATMQNQGGEAGSIYFPNYQTALLSNPNSTGLVKIEKQDRGTSKVIESFFIDNALSAVNLDVKSIFTGYEADMMRSSFAEKSISEKEKDYIKYYTDAFPGLKVRDTLIVEDDLNKNILITYEKYTIPKLFSKDSVSGEQVANFYGSEINNILPNIKDKRTQPLYIGNYDVTHQIKVVWNIGWNIDAESKSIERPDYKFNSYKTVIGDTLSVDMHMQYLNNYVSIDKIPQLINDVNLIHDDYLSHNIEHTPANAKLYPNWTAIILSLILAVALCALFYFLYQKPTSNSPIYKPAIPLSGIFIFLLFSLGANVLYSLIMAFDHNLFDLNTWQYHEFRTTNRFYKILLGIELFSYVYVAIFAVYCFILMVKRRDILPATISFFWGSKTILVVLIYSLKNIFYGADSHSDYAFVYGVIMSLVLIAYFQYSEKVKQTFTIPKLALPEEETDFEEEYEDAEAN